MIGSGEVFVLLVIIFGVVLLPLIFFLISVMKTLQECDPKNRTMEPGLVWLNLIPIFSLGWLFYTVVCVSNSLKNEFTSRGMDTENSQFGFGVGIAFAVCSAVSIIPVIGVLSAIASLILFIIYWVQVVGFKDQLLKNS